MIYLPDTNTVSAYMRGNSPVLVGNMQAMFADLRLSALARSLAVEPFTRDDSTHYAAIRHDLEMRGMGIGPFDTLIAAQALRMGATLVTRNTSEFSRVRGLLVENWH